MVKAARQRARPPRGERAVFMFNGDKHRERSGNDNRRRGQWTGYVGIEEESFGRPWRRSRDRRPVRSIF